MGRDAMIVSERQFNLLAAEYALSPRQKQIMRLLLSGVDSTEQIASRLRIRTGTVHIHFGRIYAKTHRASRAQLMYLFATEAKSATP